MTRTPETGDFWARRKAAVLAEQQAEEQAAAAAALQQEQAALEERPDDEILAELNLPDPDSLQPGDDITGFMARAVPDRLRRRALRKLWRLNPALANLDGLVDYGEDFNDPSMLLGNLQTAYQVGKGMMAHVEEMARQAEAAGREGDEDVLAPPADDADTPPCGTTSAPAEDNEPDGVSPWPEAPDPDDAPTVQADAQTQTQAPGIDAAPATPPPRRMRFSFEG
ncbi:DUF3306 domain-containing protein [Seohaeicola saemankumensis]|nr:DUF3306 domain-containing protein [Seohaeicola saemankumensis]MCA0869842.1 DUF3306 domain-containing protein [Seohaeicola saemankumensis]